MLYAPGLTTVEQIRAVVTSVDRPENVVMGLAGSDLSLAKLDALGVARVSVGSALARRALAAVVDAAREMAREGTFSFAEKAASIGEIEAAFA